VGYGPPGRKPTQRRQHPRRPAQHQRRPDRPGQPAGADPNPAHLFLPRSPTVLMSNAFCRSSPLASVTPARH